MHKNLAKCEKFASSFWKEMRNYYSFFCEEKIICLLFLGREKKREFGKRKERK
jgi:hypothetical protein